MKNKFIKIMTLAVAILVMLPGCTKAPQEGEVVPKEKLLTIGAGRTFYEGPGKANLLHKSTNVWESLTYLNNNMEAEPALAKAMTISEDGLTWTIELQEGVTFHDGSPLTAETVKKNLERNYHFSPKEKKVTQEYKNIRDMGEIKEINVIDEKTLTVVHGTIIPDFDSRLSYSSGAMFSLAAFGEDGVIISPIGSGPYSFDTYDEKSNVLTLKKFPKYRLGEPKLDKVVFKSITDADTRLSALRSGDIDVVSDVGGIMPSQTQIIEEDPNLILKQQQVSTNHYLHLNTGKGKLFSDVTMRNALSMAIDRDSIVKNLLQGYGTPAGSVVTPLAKNWYFDVGYSYDIEKAKELAKTFTKGEAKAVTILLNSGTTGRWPYEDVCLLIKEELSSLGIEAQIETVDSSTWNDRMKEGTYDIGIAPYTIMTGEPNFFFEPMMSTKGDMNIGRSYGYSNSAVDELIKNVSIEADKEKRGELYKELQIIAKEDGPLIPLWHDTTLYAMNKKVKNFDIDINFWPDLFKVDIE